MGRVIDLTGQTFSELTVLGFDGVRARKAYWSCKCSCGVVKSIQSYSLRSGATKACGHLSICTPGLAGSANINWRGTGEIPQSYWNRVMKNAKSRNLVVEVTAEWAWDLFLSQDRKCALSGLPLEFSAKTSLATASLDRVDSTEGYLPHNLQWVHKTVNQMKSDLEESLFLEMCAAVAQNQNLERVAKS